MISTLVGMARELEITSVAEGVERPEEAEAVREIGFDLAQGYLFGRPEAL
jgi:EAL domain-containing protein (putative c-di-GMP-specific phosphodiesterase class I)